MVSVEPARSSAYSADLRWRMCWQREGIGLPIEQVAKNLGVDASTVSRTCSRFLATGNFDKQPYPKGRAYRKLTSAAQLLLLHLVLDKPGVYLSELKMELANTLLLEVDNSTICRFLHASGFTRQKLRYSAIQRDEYLRQKFILDLSVYTPEMLVFLDETGADQRNLLRKYGYSMRGKPAQKQTLLVRGERVSAIANISVSGLLDVKVVKGTVDGEVFYDYIQTHLLPHLMPYNGVNPHSVVVLDNCSIHHVEGIASMIEEVSVIVHFLPPYSPDLNPIEETFSKVKAEMKYLEVCLDHVVDIKTLVYCAFTTVTPEDCQGWIMKNIYIEE